MTSNRSALPAPAPLHKHNLFVTNDRQQRSFGGAGITARRRRSRTPNSSPYGHLQRQAGPPALRGLGRARKPAVTNGWFHPNPRTLRGHLFEKLESREARLRPATIRTRQPRTDGTTRIAPGNAPNRAKTAIPPRPNSPVRAALSRARKQAVCSNCGFLGKPITIPG